MADAKEPSQSALERARGFWLKWIGDFNEEHSVIRDLATLIDSVEARGRRKGTEEAALIADEVYAATTDFGTSDEVKRAHYDGCATAAHDIAEQVRALADGRPQEGGE